MDYEKKYKNALELAKDYFKANQKLGELEENDMLSDIFPELKESEDERIRKALICGMYALKEQHKTCFASIPIDNAIAWLEKQAKLVEEYEDRLDRCACESFNKGYKAAIEHQKEKPADKVEPKFKNGQWIVWKDKCYKVNYNGCGYELVDQDGLSTSLEYGTIDENAHIWDVTTDAKDGDVLISRYNKPFIYNGNWNSLNIGSYCGITTEGMFNVATEKCYWTGNVNIHPATKEQRDILFQKMREASYEWDAEKKELKKINSYCQENCKGFQEIGKCFTDGECKAKREAEQKSTNEEMKTLLRTEYEKGRADAIAEMQNPSWSEEDECYMSECIGAIATKDGWSFEEKRKTKHWLKSLKDRYTWKPSDEEIKTLLRTEYKKGMADAIAEMQVAWSEEDEDAIGMAIIALEDMYDEDAPNTTYGGYNLPFNKAAERLKSLKGRVQPKQEWSEEDETTINNLVWAISNDCIRPQDREDYCDWLKSLKDRYSWKPSDVQIKALADALSLAKNCGEEGAFDLRTLYEQLKKLKEE